ncbi:uncharacterized protein G2W53_006611 [Senna tora]|uniref:Uncharacterized protein n=1 Tax=Senna tora TaxID=362788 RepID=A0A834X5D6_9FABA|nr:uncharacterized protein G2W53_006611 [Senna tora]
MRKTLLLWFLVLLNILTFSASATKSTSQDGDFRTSKPQMHPKYMYGVIMGSSKEGNQRTIPRLHVLQRQRAFSHAGKPINGGSNDLLRHPNSRKASDSFSIKPSSSLFMAAFRNLILGFLLFVYFF